MPQPHATELAGVACCGVLSSGQPPGSRGLPAGLHLAGHIKKARRKARLGWARTLLQLAAEFNGEATL